MNNNVFEEVLQRSDILQVCDMLGIKLNRNHMCLCPFHSEKSPSFSVSREKQIFKCFGCGESGNAIVLTAKIMGVKNLEAAKIINKNFNLGVQFKENGVKISKGTSNFEVNSFKEKRRVEEQFQNWVNSTMQILCDYSQLLNKWEHKELWTSELYEEAINYKDYIDYVFENIFINGDNQDKLWFWKNERKFLANITEKIKLQKNRRCNV